MDFNDFINVLILGLVHCSSAKSLCFTGAGSRIECIGVVLVSPFPPSTISLSLSEEIFSFFSHYRIPHGSGKKKPCPSLDQSEASISGYLVNQLSRVIGIHSLFRDLSIFLQTFYCWQYILFRFGAGGHQERKNALCILGLNMINDKIFLIIWWPEYWPLIGQYKSRDLNTGLLLVNTDHVTWILASDWSMNFITPSENAPCVQVLVHDAGLHWTLETRI